MNPKDQRELEVTRAKLRLREESYLAARRDRAGDPRAQELELRSLKSLINQLKEEIARFEGRAALQATKTAT